MWLSKPTPVSSLKKEYAYRKSEHYKTTWYDTPNISINNSKLHKTHTTRPKIKVFIDTDAKPSSRPSAAVRVARDQVRRSTSRLPLALSSRLVSSASSLRFTSPSRRSKTTRRASERRRLGSRDLSGRRRAHLLSSAPDASVTLEGDDGRWTDDEGDV